MSTELTTVDPCTLFPANPTHGMLFEQKNGVIYQYDAAIHAWLKLASDNIVLPLATTTRDGAMSLDDFKKLNRLVIPPPISSIIGTDCLASYQRGSISLYSGDQFVSVDGHLDVQNIDQFGDQISEEVPFQIHQHTYGFDFTVDAQQLISELERRGQIRLSGRDGQKGDTGETGDPGINGVMAGPPGDSGNDGSAPTCTLSIEPETFQAQTRPGLKRALVDVRVIPDVVDDRNFALEFDRQVVGNENGSASQFRVKQIESTWLLAVSVFTDESDTTEALNCGVPGERRNQFYTLFYIDIEPILNTIQTKFFDEVERLKKGYQDIVAFWVQTMSDLFDEQKDALCCALENCISGKKSTHAREHMETIAALALGKAKINLHGRHSKQAVELSSTRLLHELGGPDLCKGGPDFPQNPVAKRGDDDGDSAVVASSASVTPLLIDIDPLVNSAISSSKQIELPQGIYVATIKQATAQVNNMHRSNVKIRYVSNGEHKTTQFLDKGAFSSLIEAQSAYEGLSISFKHDGGFIEAFLPSIQPRQSSGQIKILIDKTSETVVIPVPEPIQSEILTPKVSKTDKPRRKKQKESKAKRAEVVTTKSAEQCQMSVSHLAWYESGWSSGRCCGLVVNVAGQDYIVVKRSIGSEDNCGGGESLDTPCIAKFTHAQGHPAFAWPTFDGRTFAPIPASGFVTFEYDKALNELVAAKIAKSEYNNGVGNPNGIRHLSYQLMTILFPSAQ